MLFVVEITRSSLLDIVILFLGFWFLARVGYTEFPPKREVDDRILDVRLRVD